MTDKPPLVTIGLPVYNGADFLEEAIESITNQSFTDFELIISDNASTDGTQEICERFARLDSRIRYHRNPVNYGAAWNYNRVFRLGRGRYFKWAAHDDLLSSEFLAQSVAVLDDNPDVALCYARTVVIDEAGRRLGSYPDEMRVMDESPYERWRAYLRRYFPRVDKCNAIFGLGRTDVLMQTPLIGRYLSSDMVLLGELALRGKIYEIDGELFFRRDHPKMSVRANPNFENRAIWFDPANKGKIILRRWRWFIEYLGVLRRTPMPLADRVKCIAFFLKHYLRWSGRQMLAELVSGGKQRLGRRNPGHRQALSTAPSS